MKTDYKNQRPSFQVPKRTLIQRFPVAFQAIVIGSLLSILFSKPLYDAFIADYVPTPKSIELQRKIDERYGYGSRPSS